MLEEKAEVQETASAPVNTPEVPLFKNYEIRSWKLSPRIYKILSASLVLNVVAILVMGQSNMLTRKGCESPLVGGVCQVLDMMDLGGELLGMDSGYVDGQFTNIDLANSDITFVDLTGREESQLKYPDGYFAIANPEQFQPELVETADGSMPGFPTNIPGFPSNPTMTTRGDDPGAKAPVLPPPVKTPIDSGQLPDFDGDTGAIASNNPRSGRMPRVKTPRVTPEKTPAPPAQNTTDPANMPTVPIDRTFLRDFGQNVKGRIDRKEVDILAPFVVTATGKLDESGKIDPATYKASAQANDPRIVEVVEDAIEAVNSGGYLKYLEIAGLARKDLQLSISQDNDFITGTVLTEAETETRAKNLKFFFTNMINSVKEKKERPEATEDDKDDLELLKNATVEIQGKKLIIKFAVPKATAHALIQKKLINNNNAQEPAKPSGGIQNGGSNPTAGK